MLPLLLILLATPARNGQGLLDLCAPYVKHSAAARGEPVTSDAVACHYFVMGFMEAAVASDAICPPRGVTFDQAAGVIVRHVRTRPDRAQVRGSVLTMEALRRAYPCASRKE